MSTVGAAPGIRAAAIPLWNLPQGAVDVAAHTGSLDEVSPEALRIGPFGSVLSVARDGDEATAMATLRATGLALVPSISNRVDGHRSPDVVTTMLHDPARTARHVQLLCDVVASHDYQGVDLDYQGLRREDRAAFSRFVARLAEALHERGRRLSVTVYAKAEERLDERPTQAQDYGALGQAADEVRLVTWDYHAATTVPGPLAPIDWVRGVVAHAVGRIAEGKVLLGVSASGYDWTRRGAERVGRPEALALADRYAAGRVEHDPLGEAPWFRYLDEHGNAHEVWFEDARSVGVKRQVAAEYGARGIVLWLSATPETDVWTEVGKAL
jgi:spore germination protein